MSNSPILADSTALPANGSAFLSRRDFFRRAPAAALATAAVLTTSAAVAVVALPPPAHASEAVLLDIERRLRELLARQEPLQLEAYRTGRLAAPRWGACPHPAVYRATSADERDATRRWKRAKRDYDKRVARINEQTGYAAALREQAEVKEQIDEIYGTEIWRTKAVTLVGLKAKARIAAMRGRMCASTIQDLIDLEI